MTAAHRRAQDTNRTPTGPSATPTNEESDMQRSVVLRDAIRLSEADTEAHVMFACLREALAHCQDVRGARIARARTAVQLRVVDPVTGEGSGPVLFCDRPEPAVSMDGGPAEVTITLSPEQARRFCHGDLQLSTALVDGDVTATGPARKFLVVEPIVRSLLAARPDRATSA
jgi:hypothetical protein